jgi:hypothetical protein
VPSWSFPYDELFRQYTADRGGVNEEIRQSEADEEKE